MNKILVMLGIVVGTVITLAVLYKDIERKNNIIRDLQESNTHLIDKLTKLLMEGKDEVL